MCSFVVMMLLYFLIKKELLEYLFCNEKARKMVIYLLQTGPAIYPRCMPSVIVLSKFRDSHLSTTPSKFHLLNVGSYLINVRSSYLNYHTQPHVSPVFGLQICGYNQKSMQNGLAVLCYFKRN